MLPFKKLTIRREGRDTLVGDPETGNFIQLQAEGMRILNALRKKPVETVVRQFPEVNVSRFISELRANGFLINRRAMHRRRYLNSHIAQRHLNWMYAKPTVLAFIALIGWAFWTVVQNATLFPRSVDFFFSESAWFLPLTFALSWLLIGIHEWAHYLAAVASGIPSRFGISTQLFSITAVTDLSNLYMLPPKKRYPVLLAGMMVDAAICAAALLAMHWFGSAFAELHWAIPLLKLIALVEFMGIVWELQMFMETDPYYVLETFFGVHNLHAQGLAVLSTILRGNFRAVLEMRWIYPTYALLMMGGAATLVWQFTSYTVPILQQLFFGAFDKLYIALLAGVPNFAAAINLIAIGTTALLYAIGLLHHYSRSNHPLRFTFLYSLLAAVVNALLFLISLALLPFGTFSMAIGCFSAAVLLGMLLSYELDQEFSAVNTMFLLMLGLPVLLISGIAQYQFFTVMIGVDHAAPIAATMLGMLIAFLCFIPLAEHTVYRTQNIRKR